MNGAGDARKFDLHRQLASRLPSIRPGRYHTVAAIVAAAVLLLALHKGGYSAELRAGAAVAVWWVVLAGLASGVWPRERPRSSGLVAAACLAALAVLAGASVGWASDDGRAFAEVARASGYLGLFVLVVLAARPGEARAWVCGLALGLTAVGVVALAGRLVPGVEASDELIAFLPDAQARLSSPVGYWNGLAACMALAVVLLAGLAAGGRTRAGRSLAAAAVAVPALAIYLSSSRGGALAAAVGLVALGLGCRERARLLLLGLAGAGGAGAAILFVSTRGTVVDNLDSAAASGERLEALGVLLAAVAISAAAAYWLDPRSGRLRLSSSVRRPAAAVALILVAALVVVAEPGERVRDFKRPPAENPAVAERGFTARHLTSSSGGGRYQYWSAAWEAFEHRPVVGIGAGGYQSWWARHGALSLQAKDAHSLFLETLAELGVVGLVLLLGFFGASAAGGLRSARAGPGGDAAILLAVLASGLTSAAIDWTWELPIAFAPVLVAAALLATGPARPLATHRVSRARRVAVMAVTAMVVLAALGIAAVSFATESLLARSRAAARSDDLSLALEKALAARAAQPFSSAPRLQLALVHERRGELVRARAAARDAAERAPEDWRPWLVLARLETRQGDPAAAIAALGTARRNYPRSPILDDFPPKGGQNR